MSKSKFTFPGDVFLSRVDLWAHGSEVSLDIRPNIDTIDVYENVAALTTLCEIRIVDSLGIRNNLNISGGEYVEVAWKTPGYDTLTVFKGHIYRIKNRVVENERSESYTMVVVSASKYKNDTTTISKAYSGTHTTIIKTLWADAFGTKYSQIIDPIDESSAPVQVVIPNWRPIYAAQWLVSRCSNPYDLVFFQNANGFNLRSLRLMMQQTPAAKFYKTENPKTAEGKFRGVYNTNHHVTSTFFDNLTNGGFASRTIAHDILHKSFEEKVFSYTTEFADINPGNQFPIIDGRPDRNEYGDVDPSSPDSTINYITETRSGLDKLENLDITAAFRQSITNILLTNKITIEVPGDSQMKIGDVVEYDPLSPEPSNRGNSKEYIQSGRWLVVAVRHSLNTTRYNCFLELAKVSQPRPKRVLKTLKGK